MIKALTIFSGNGNRELSDAMGYSMSTSRSACFQNSCAVESRGGAARTCSDSWS